MAGLEERSRKSLQRLAKLFNIKANQKSDAIRTALRAHSSQISILSSPEAESGETTQSHDENRGRNENKSFVQKAPFPPRRLEAEISAEDSQSAPDDSAHNCGASSAFSEEASFEDAVTLPSSHDAVSLPLPVKQMQQSCSVTDNVTDIPEAENLRHSTALDATQSVSAPLGSVPTPRHSETSAPEEEHNVSQSAFAGSHDRGGAAARPREKGHATHRKKSGTQALIEKRGVPFAFHQEQSGHHYVREPDLAFMFGRRSSHHHQGGSTSQSAHASHPTLPSHSNLRRPSRQTSSDEALAPVPVRVSSEALPPPRPADMHFSVPMAPKQDLGAQTGPSSRPEWNDDTTATDIPAVPSRPRTAYPRSTPPPRVSTSRSTPPVHRKGSPARIRPPNSPSNGSRVMPPPSSHRAQSLMPHRTPPRITPPSQQSGTPSRGAASRGTQNTAKQRNTASGEGQNFEDNEMASCRNAVMSEVLVTSPSVRWADIAGMESTKRILQEAVVLPSMRPDIFTGLRAPSRGCLLFGPPGTGKTMLAKAIATEAQATFFSMSASSLTSRYVGRGEKMVRALFEIAESMQPSIIFLDEMDSILSARSTSEHEASRRMKTEFLLRFDGLKPGLDSRVIVIGATNRPGDLDDAVCRRLSRRIYVQLPDHQTRRKLLQITLDPQICVLSEDELDQVATATDGYSGSDLTSLCKEAAMRPVRELSSDQLAIVDVQSLRTLTSADILGSMAVVKPSVQASVLKSFESWNAEFGSDMASV